MINNKIINMRNKDNQPDDITNDIKNNIFVVENPGNSCYIDSLFMALFYAPSYIKTILLTTNLKYVDSLYLQECIKSQFINIIKNNKSVSIENMNFIKYILMQNGWKTFEELFEQQDISEFYTFIIKKFKCHMIEIKQKTLTEDTFKYSYGKIEQIPFIPLSIPKNTDTGINIKDMLHNWMYDNPVKKYNNDITSNILYSYEITNIPIIVALYINRFSSNGCRKDVNILIQKKIKLFKTVYENENVVKWIFHAAICHVGSTNKSGHYYTLLIKNKDWYIFDDQQIPCLKKIEMNDKKLSSKVRKECVFLLYKLDT
jgi:uncharacterized UBP type Zn finger protein